MTYLKAEHVSWSEEQQKRFKSALVETFATDAWSVGPTNASIILHFDFSSPALQTEMKYAFWCKLEQGTWKAKATIVQVVQAWKYLALRHERSYPWVRFSLLFSSHLFASAARSACASS